MYQCDLHVAKLSIILRDFCLSCMCRNIKIYTKIDLQFFLTLGDN